MNKIKSTLAAALLAISGVAQANVVNGGFEFGLAGWSTTGTTATSGSAFAGAAAAVITTGANEDVSTFSGASIAGTGGGGIQQTFSMGSAGTLSFQWNFVSGEGVGSSYNDASYVVIDGVATLLEDSSGGGPNGYSLFSANLAAGSHTVSFVATDFGDDVVDSFLYVDAVSATSNVPEPGSLALLGLGLMGLAAARKRK